MIRYCLLFAYSRERSKLLMRYKHEMKPTMERTISWTLVDENREEVCCYAFYLIKRLGEMLLAWSFSQWRHRHRLGLGQLQRLPKFLRPQGASQKFFALQFVKTNLGPQSY